MVTITETVEGISVHNHESGRTRFFPYKTILGTGGILIYKIEIGENSVAIRGEVKKTEEGVLYTFDRRVYVTGLQNTEIIYRPIKLTEVS